MSIVTQIKKMQDSEELYIDVPQELLDRLGWDKGSELTFSFDEDTGVIYITKNNKD